MGSKFLLVDDDERVDRAGRDHGETLWSTANPAMRLIEARVVAVASIDIPVLISGETGTGKDVLARWLHQQSRREGPLLKLRCSRLRPCDLDGVVGELAGGGTVLLDEIAEFGLDCQAKALESLFEKAEGSAIRLGVIATSVQDPGSLLSAAKLREDVYFRLSGVLLRLPPLRERQEDIVPLVEFFLDRYARIYGKPLPRIDTGLTLRLREYSWPGNIRELENAAKRMVALGEDGAALTIPAGRVSRPEPAAAADAPRSLKQASRAASRQAERELILKVLSRTRWNRKRAAEELQISYKALLYKLKQIGLDESAS